MITRQDLEYNGIEFLRWEDNKETAKLFVEEFLKTNTGKQLLEHGLKTADNMESILSAAQEAYGHGDISLKEFESVAKRMFLNGDLLPKATPVVAAPAAPKLSSSQLAWQEFRIFTDTHSVQDCKNRARVDENYRKFLHTNLQREISATPVGDAVESVGTQAVKQTRTVKITQQLSDFVWSYRAMSAAEVRKNSNIATNPNAASFNQLIADAISAGLL
jgi:hypothetical protein